MPAPTEKQIRDAIVALVQSADPSLIAYDRYRIPQQGLLSEFNALNVNDEKQINVCFVRRVSFADEVSSFDDFIAARESYELWFYRGVVDAADGLDSENTFQAMLESVRALFRLEANRHLGFDNAVSQGGIGTAGPLVNTDELGGFACHRFVASLVVFLGEC